MDREITADWKFSGFSQYADRDFRAIGHPVLENFLSSELWGGVGTGVAWMVTVCLLIAGAIGCVLPVLPGHLIIFVAAIGHRLMLGAEGSGLQWWSFVILGILMAFSQTLEVLSGAAGSKWFGGTRWGAFGAIVGMIGGLFFMPFGLLVGPLAGAFAFEKAFAKKDTKPAVISGVGSVVGTLAGMGIKVALGAVMIVWFLLDVLMIG
jgi:uncharacterized protein YqgC (DUF456 family)